MSAYIDMFPRIVLKALGTSTTLAASFASTPSYLPLSAVAGSQAVSDYQVGIRRHCPNTNSAQWWHLWLTLVGELRARWRGPVRTCAVRVVVAPQSRAIHRCCTTGEELSQARLVASGAAEPAGLRREGCEGGRVVCKSVLLRAEWSLHDLHRRRRHHVFRRFPATSSTRPGLRADLMTMT